MHANRWENQSSETGAQVAQFLIDNLSDLATRYVSSPLQNTHPRVMSFTQRVAGALTSHVASNAADKFRGVMSYRNSPRF